MQDKTVAGQWQTQSLHKHGEKQDVNPSIMYIIVDVHGVCIGRGVGQNCPTTRLHMFMFTVEAIHFPTHGYQYHHIMVYVYQCL